MRNVFAVFMRLSCISCFMLVVAPFLLAQAGSGLTGPAISAASGPQTTRQRNSDTEAAASPMSPSPVATVDNDQRTVTTNNFTVKWYTGVDSEAITSLQWKGQENVTGTNGIGTCYRSPNDLYGTEMYFGNAYGPPDPWQGGLVLVGGGTTTPAGKTAWSGQILPAGDAQVVINSVSTNCPPVSAGINVQTTYIFPTPNDPNTNWFKVQRVFDFSSTTFDHNFKAYMPRLFLGATTGYREILYPTIDDTLGTVNIDGCSFDCTSFDPPWASEQGWFAVHDALTGKGVVVKREPSFDPQGNPITAILDLDYDNGSSTGPATNDSSFQLVSPAGGFRGGKVTESETLCFYDSTLWTPSTTPPAACSNLPVSFSPSSLTFSDQEVGTTSATLSSLLLNAQASTLNISSITADGDFDLATTSTSCPYTGGAVSSQASCTIDVKFKPTGTGTRTGTVRVNDDAVDSPQMLSLSGTGTGPKPVASLSSVPAFGSQNVGTSSSPQPAILSNTGDADLTISSIATSGDFSQTNNCPSKLAAGGHCTMDVTFTPTGNGTRTGTLTVTDDSNSVTGSVQSDSLSGTGLAPAVTLTPTSLTFSTQPIGTTSASKSVKLTNDGSLPLSLTNFLASGDFSFTSNCLSTLAVSASCTLNVSFKPTAAGTRTGTISIIDNAPDSPQTLSLTGTGTPPPVTVSPSSLTFSSQAVGTTSTSQRVTLTNNGSGPLTVTSVLASGDFSQTNNCGMTVAASASCTINVTFQPVAAGTRTGTLTIVDNASNSPQLVNLIGTVVAATVTLTPPTLTFSDQQVGVASASQPATLTNTGSGPVTVASIVASGDFSQTNNCGFTLAASAFCTINVTFKPTATGTRNGVLTVNDNATGSPHTVGLSGAGINDRPVPVSVVPGSGSGSSATFTATFSDTQGAANIKLAYLLLNGGLSGVNGCAVMYATGHFYLLNDAGTQWPIIPGSLSNSQCTVNAAGASVSSAGNTLRFSLPISFNTGNFKGLKQIYLQAVDHQGHGPGWTRLATWQVAPNAAPAADAVTPNSGSGASAVFHPQYSDADGAADLRTLYFLVNQGWGRNNGCYVMYAGGALYLATDNGLAWQGPLAVGSAGSLGNSQCTLAGTGAAAAASGNSVTLSLPLSFNSSFFGSKSLSLQAVDNQQATSGWVIRGTWTPNADAPPSADSALAVQTGANPPSWTIAATYSDANGHDDLRALLVVVNHFASVGQSCAVLYANSGLYLLNDASTAWQGPIPLGSAATLSNSQCTITGAGASLVPNGNSLTLTVPITRQAGFAGNNVYLNAEDKELQFSGWKLAASIAGP
jgi:Abnormal spindle-like microcephaly-assoc'd, ASPM-SPD-2-Hydin